MMSLIICSHVYLLSAFTLQCHLSAADELNHFISKMLTMHPGSSSGHLKPLGSEATRLPISEVNQFPSPTEFFQHYVYPSIPVVFRHGARRSPAYEKWTDEYLKSLPESQELISVEMRKIENRSISSTMMPFAEFIDRYTVHDEYLVSAVPEFLKKDVLVPSPLLCDNITANFLDTILWFSGGGTKSVLHNDDVDNLNCLFSGQKEILFINYTKYRQQIVFDHPAGSFSSVDVERVDFNEYPEFRNVEFSWAKLEAGDCIYIPYKWYHQVNSINRNLAVNIWWNHKANIIPTPVTCGNPDPELSFADVRFHMHDVMNDKEEEVIHPELVFLENPGQSVTTFMAEEGQETLTEDQLVTILSTKLPMLQGAAWNREALDIGHKIFQQFDMDDDGEITPKDLVGLPNEEGMEEGPFEICLQQKLMVLIDIIDEELSKQRLKQLQKLLGVATEKDSGILSSSQDSKRVGTVDETKADKDEL